MSEKRKPGLLCWAGRNDGELGALVVSRNKLQWEGHWCCSGTGMMIAGQAAPDTGLILAPGEGPVRVRVMIDREESIK
jgi:hypothetical protein